VLKNEQEEDEPTIHKMIKQEKVYDNPFPQDQDDDLNFKVSDSD
jgi:hypothetical protein